MERWIAFVLAFFLAMGLSPASSAQTAPPQELNKWKGWVLEKHPDIDCPRLSAQANKRRCAWPGNLTIEVDASGARFSQSWEIYGESWIKLPGNQQHWPSEVKLNGANAAVLEQKNLPVLRLAPGSHSISGEISWGERPQYLQIPRDTALINVSVNGEQQAWPNIDNNGRLWFKRQSTQVADAGKGDSVRVEVFRRVNDGVPITMRSILRMVVSGKPREVVLGRLLLDGSEETLFESPLPARIEEDGSLRIQVRAGTWQVKMNSRFTSNVATLNMQTDSEEWPAQEIWSFASDPNTRGVKINGVQALDPAQLDMPENWNNIPTYLVERSSDFIIEEQYRGDINPSANQINANRVVWLDFDGSGATVKDNLSGTMNQGWRLSTQSLLNLGRVSVNGQPQLVTKMEGDDSGGIEIRQQHLNVEAISRLQDRGDLSAAGWQHDLDSLKMTLNLPPGWQLWHASGADTINHSWLSRWDLWDLFLCLLIVGATFKLLGMPWAVLATLTLALTYHENNAPVATWVMLIIILPLLKVLPAGALRNMTQRLGYLMMLTLIIISLLFAVQQVRRGLYPQLEMQRVINAKGGGYGRGLASNQPLEEVVVTAQKASGDEVVMYDAADMVAEDALVEAEGRVLLKQASPASVGMARQEKFKRYQPSANTQTGPNQPTWRWHTVRLNWSGPVTADAPLQLYLSPPWLSRLLWFAQVGMVGLLVFGFARLLLQLANKKDDGNDDKTDDTPPGATPAAATAVLLAAIIGHSPTAVEAADAFPPEHLLKEWEERLLKEPKCAPHCLAINGAQVNLRDNTLHIRMRVGTGTRLGVPLPMDKTWQVQSVSVNGDESDSLAKDGGRLWLTLGQGNFDIHIQGKVSGDSVNVTFPLMPHNVSVNAGDWEVFGLQDNRVPSRSLQLQKREKEVTQDALLPDPVSPYVKVQREIAMDLDWHIFTLVSRRAPRQGGMSIKIPLLEGEKVLDENLQVIEEDGKRYVNAIFGARQSSVSWSSQMEPTPTVTFTASDDPQFFETFSAETTPRWNMSWEGLTPIKNNSHNQGASPTWLPWPGESVTLKLVKPEPVEGATTTVESVTINSKPGARSTDLELLLSINTSLGGDFRIKQPDNAKLERIAIDGREIPKQEDDGTVILPLRPGVQSASINWAISEGVALSTSTPKIELSEPAGNIDLTLTLPQSRWPLIVSGPDIGPAMLYWGVMIVILAVAVALGRIIRQKELSIPVNTWQWVLLALGMSTVNMLGSLPVVLWFFAMEARKRFALPDEAWKFNLMQLAYALITLIALISLFATIPESLLSTPDMQVTGNGSYNYFYNWYQDNSEAQLPQGTVISVPIWVYRVAMLAWSLWLVFAILKWAKWGWGCFNREKLWASKPAKGL